ncbi:MAG TPA: hypothetical protein VGO47_11445, partial [Chlamydiales bacterium]|nr:hypothetical protein [Chlamydiales bacterium]
RERIFGGIIPIDAVKAAVAIATDCEKIERSVRERFQKTPHLYYRFNVDQGMQSIDLADFDKVQNVTAHTDSYMKNEPVSEMLRDTVSALLERKATILTSQISME